MHANCIRTTYGELICSFHYACVDTYYYKKTKKNHIKRKHQQARMQQVFACEEAQWPGLKLGPSVAIKWRHVRTSQNCSQPEWPLLPV